MIASLATLSLATAAERQYRFADMTSRYILHLSIPVSELASAKRFYVESLGATVGRENDEWLDIHLWGHQITLHRRPEEVLPTAKQGKRHFGVVLPWSEWERQAARIKVVGVGILGGPTIEMSGTDDEHGKLYLHDPSGNVIELKAYRNLQRTLGLAE
jgi:extradiol dioxygenase family protein